MLSRLLQPYFTRSVDDAYYVTPQPIPVESTTPSLTFRDYYEYQVDLKKYKMPQLKSLIREHKLRLTGNKIDLIERLKSHFHNEYYAVKIQRMFRGHIARCIIRLRGPALKDRSICVNETDFCTLDPLDEIPMCDFYSYRDKNNQVYGFDIHSLYNMFKTGKSINPYNRDVLDDQTKENIFQLVELIPIFYAKPTFNPAPLPKKASRRVDVQVPPPQSVYQVNNELTNVFISNTHSIFPNYDSVARLNQLREIQAKPVDVRIRELFIEMDHLGSYTNSSWFQLQRRDYFRLFQVLYDVWYYRGQMAYDTRYRISPLADPFVGSISTTVHFNMNEDEIKEECLKVMEYMIYTGVDQDHRILGKFHVLSALTIVSPDARDAMPWLYDSLVY